MPFKNKEIGIYGIFEDDELIYIGKTNFYKRRVSQHKSDAKYRPDILMVDKYIHLSKKKIDFKLLLECSEEELSEKEKEFILKKKPKLNSLVSDKDMSLVHTKDAIEKMALTNSKKINCKIYCKEFENIFFDNAIEWVEFLSKKGININTKNILDAKNGKTKNGYAKGLHFLFIDK